MIARRRLLAAAAAAALVLVAGPSAAGASVDAHGSARQVYATGLAAGARATLLSPAGRRLARLENGDATRAE